MGTRAMIRVFEGDKEILTLYRQSDGYPDGLGRDLEPFGKFGIVSGITNPDAKATANGARCFALQLVAALKKGIGGLYLYELGIDAAECGCEYEYHLRCPSLNEAGNVKLDMFAVRRGAKLVPVKP